MKGILKVTFLILLYFVSFPAESRAQSVYSASDTVHYNWNGHNEMLGIAWGQSDYNTRLYYCGNSAAFLVRFEDDVAVDYNSVNTNISCPIAGPPYEGNELYSAEASLPYIATSDYEVTGWQTLRPFFENGFNYYDSYRYSDYDYLGQQGLPIAFPLAYSFLGIGSPEWIDYNTFILGYINAFREALSTTTSSAPHHLRVEEDKFVTTSCGGIRRLVKYAIVDNSMPKGKKVGKTPHREYLTPTELECFAPGTFPEEPITACHLGITGNPPHYVGLTDDNPFTDRLTAGCTHPGPNCGAKVNDHTWRWCKSTGQIGIFDDSVILATVPGEARVSFVKLKGKLHNDPWPKGTEFFP